MCIITSHCQKISRFSKQIFLLIPSGKYFCNHFQRFRIYLYIAGGNTVSCQFRDLSDGSVQTVFDHGYIFCFYNTLVWIVFSRKYLIRLPEFFSIGGIYFPFHTNHDDQILCNCQIHVSFQCSYGNCRSYRININGIHKTNLHIFLLIAFAIPGVDRDIFGIYNLCIFKIRGQPVTEICF